MQSIITNVLKTQTLEKEYILLVSKEKMKYPHEVAEKKQWVITHRCSVQQSHEIVEGKMSHTCFVGISVTGLVHSFVNSKKKVHSPLVSVKDYYDMNSETLSFPCILRTNRVSGIIKTTVKEDKVTEKLKII